VILWTTRLYRISKSKRTALVRYSLKIVPATTVQHSRNLFLRTSPAVGNQTNLFYSASLWHVLVVQSPHVAPKL
jgi:hypothetical protein